MDLTMMMVMMVVVVMMLMINVWFMVPIGGRFFP